MSMISMQVDRLRDTAMRVETFLDGSTDAIPTDTHEQLRDAADTIWQLRNDCVELRDEKDILTRLLREALEKKFSDEDDMRAENAKLRELIRTVWLAGDFSAFIGVDEIKERMRKLGIEVEDA